LRGPFSVGELLALDPNRRASDEALPRGPNVAVTEGERWLPGRLSWLGEQRHTGLPRSPVGLAPVARLAGRDAILPARWTPARTWEHVVNGQALGAWPQAAELAGETITPKHSSTGEASPTLGDTGVGAEHDHLGSRDAAGRRLHDAHPLRVAGAPAVPVEEPTGLGLENVAHFPNHSRDRHTHRENGDGLPVSVENKNGLVDHTSHCMGVDAHARGGCQLS
jgi:hypothetical protein